MKPFTAALTALLLATAARAAEPKLPVLIVDGVNNHDWATGTFWPQSD